MLATKRPTNAAPATAPIGNPLPTKDLHSGAAVLVVDDERALVELLAYNLRSSGYRVETACNGRDALARAFRRPPDLVLLDVMMPVMTGLTVARRLREHETTRSVPIIMLTARDRDADQLRGFSAGADDYIAKPFSMELLLARVEAILRRTARAADQVPPSELRFGPLRINIATFQAFADENLLQLTATEFRLLAGLVSSNSRVLSRRDLISAAMGPGVTITERTIDVHITSIRRKLGPHASLIRTVRGVGYCALLDAELSRD